MRSSQVSSPPKPMGSNDKTVRPTPYYPARAAFKSIAFHSSQNHSPFLPPPEPSRSGGCSQGVCLNGKRKVYRRAEVKQSYR
jgi:hypothetical protein